MVKLLPQILTAVLLLAIGAQRQARPQTPDAPAYHAAVRAAVAEIPARIGDWVGTDVPVPTAAQSLLRPNAIFTRTYYRQSRPARATLVVVQCRDSRDMIGHYPPACYPAHGWVTVGAPSSVVAEVASQRIPVARHHFMQPGLDDRAEMVIHGYFVLPGKGPTRDMSEVRRASSDYLTRSLGAAQIQVLMEAGLSPEEEGEIFRDLVTPLMPMIRLLQSVSPGATS